MPAELLLAESGGLPNRLYGIGQKRNYMNQVTLVSTRSRPIQPLVESALSNELRLLEAAIRKTERRLLKFEGEYGMTSLEFVQRYENDELAEVMDYVDWIGEYRLLARLQEKADAYREIRFVH